MKNRLIEILRTIFALILSAIFMSVMIPTILTIVIPISYWFITGNSYFDIILCFIEFIWINILKDENAIQEKKDFEYELRYGGPESYML